MSKLVLINGKTAVHAGSGGLLVTKDVCLTGQQKQPVTYTNVAKSKDASNTAKKTFIHGHPACHQQSCFKKSTGDEAGNHKGQHSGTIQGKAEFLSGSGNVLIEGQPAVRNGEKMVSNNRNTAPGHLQQSNGPVPSALQLRYRKFSQPTIYANQHGVELAINSAALLFESVGVDDGSGCDDFPLAKAKEPGKQSCFMRLSPLTAGQQPLQLRIDDDWFGRYGIDLGHFETVTLQQDYRKSASVLVPLQLKRYDYAFAPGAPKPTAAEKNVLSTRQLAYHSASLRAGGYVYIFMDGFLWRELKVLTADRYQDVHLGYYHGYDERPASGQSLVYVTVPQTIGTQQKKITIAYSEVQWSWAYINALGGMNPADSRLKQRPQPGPDEHRRLPAGIKPDKHKRLQDITEQLASWQSIPLRPEPTPNTLPVNNNTVVRQRQDHGLTCYVHDPLGIAERLAADIALTYHDLIANKIEAQTGVGAKQRYQQTVKQDQLQQDQALQRMQQDARLGPGVAFAESLHLRDQAEQMDAEEQFEKNLMQHPQQMYEMASLVQQIVAAKPKYKQYVNMERIKQTLHWDQQVRILDRLNALTGYAGKFLTTDGFATVADGMSVAIMMQDYWAHTGEQYLQGLALAGMLTEYLCLMAGYPYLVQLVKDSPSLLSPVFKPNTQQLITLSANDLAAVAMVTKGLAGAVVKEQVVRERVTTYLTTVIDHFSAGKWQLRRTSIDLHDIVEQLSATDTSRPFSWGQMIHSEGQVSHVKLQLFEVVASNQQEKTFVSPWGKKINWLKQHDQLISKGAAGLFMVLEAVNLGEVYWQWQKNKTSVNNNLAMASALLKVTSAALEILKEVRKFDVNALGLPEVAEKMMLGDVIGNLAKTTRITSLIGNALAVTYDLSSALEDFHNGDTTLGTLSCLNAIGDTALMISSRVGSLVELQEISLPGKFILSEVDSFLYRGLAEGGLEMGGVGIAWFELLGWAGAAILIISTVLEIIFAKTPLEDWLAHGPFGREVLKSPWQDPATAYQDLLTMLYSFEVDHQFYPDDPSANILSLTIYLPLFIPGQSRFYFQLAKASQAHDFAWQKIAIDLQRDVTIKLSPTQLSTIRIDVAAGADLYRAQALLDLRGDGKVLIPVLFNQQNQAAFKPLTVSFTAPTKTQWQRYLENAAGPMPPDINST